MNWEQHKEAFARDGFVILRGFASAEEVTDLRAVAERDLHPPIGPLEYEADVQYEGAPDSLQDEGGRTPRRLLNALARSFSLRRWATQPRLGQMLTSLFDGRDARLYQNHHNCLMTKYPQYGTATQWHQDIRYWAFERPDLVSFWLALGEEVEENGALRFLPGSHNWRLEPEQLDKAKFLRTDYPGNQPLLDSAVQASLEPGDLVFFHSRTFHAAGPNLTQDVKLSLVFTAHDVDNRPLLNTRSDRFPSLPFRDSL